jgi:hypothetical protein
MKPSRILKNASSTTTSDLQGQISPDDNDSDLADLKICFLMHKDEIVLILHRASIFLICFERCLDDPEAKNPIRIHLHNREALLNQKKRLQF